MSSGSPLLNGDNAVVSGQFVADPSVTMVAAIRDHITCAKTDPFSTQDVTKAKLVTTYSCDFDHMYASLNESNAIEKDNPEVKHLKDLLLLHLDLIQQQSEQIVTKDKQLSALRQENDTLRQRLERMDRRVTLQQKQREIHHAEILLPVLPPPTPPPLPPPPPAVLTVTPSPVPVEVSVPVDPLEISSPSTGDQVSALSPQDSSLLMVTPSHSRRGRRSIACGESTSSLPSVSGRGRRRLSSWSSSVVSDSTQDSRGRKRKSRSKAPLLKKNEDSYLFTEYLYYTLVGDNDVLWGNVDEPEPQGNVEVPSWRKKIYTSYYAMECTENLHDEIFARRHQRFEIDERRRKRWDVQRIREQRHIERLKQRELASRRARASQGEEGSDEPIISLWPQVEDLEVIDVTDKLPVTAFGAPIPKFTPSEFSLPWLSGEKHEVDHNMFRKRQRRDSKR